MEAEAHRQAIRLVMSLSANPSSQPRADRFPTVARGSLRPDQQQAFIFFSVQQEASVGAEVAVIAVAAAVAALQVVAAAAAAKAAIHT
jgi:hypothetical protein